MADQLVVGAVPTTSLPANTPANLLGDPLGGLVVSELYGKYYNLTKAGVVFIGTSAVGGVVPPVAGTTSPTFGLWNPAGNNRNFVLISLNIGYVSTTAAAGSLTWSTTIGAGNVIATAAPISAFTSATPVNGVVGGGQVSTSKFCPGGGTTTLSSAAVVNRNTGFNTDAITAASTNTPWTWHEDYDGTFIVPPGVAIWLTCTTAILMTIMPQLIWAELPL